LFERQAVVADLAVFEHGHECGEAQKQDKAEAIVGNEGAGLELNRRLLRRPCVPRVRIGAAAGGKLNATEEKCASGGQQQNGGEDQQPPSGAKLNLGEEDFAELESRG